MKTTNDNSTTTPPFASCSNVSYNPHTKEVKSALIGYPYAQTYQPSTTIGFGVQNGVRYKSKTKIITNF